LSDSAKALAFNNVPTREEIKEAIFRTLITNGMFDNTHIRLSLTRGKKVTSGMSPAFNRYGCTLIGKVSDFSLASIQLNSVEYGFLSIIVFQNIV
jgi:hypothetical protein